MYVSREAWRKKQELDLALNEADTIAPCTNDPDAWFSTDTGGMRENYYDLRAAKAGCEACPVKLLCLEFALINEEEFGIWGGMTPGERVKFRTKNQLSRRGGNQVRVTAKDFCTFTACNRPTAENSQRQYCAYHERTQIVCKHPNCVRELTTRVSSGLCEAHRETILICAIFDCTEPTIIPKQAKRCEQHFQDLPDCLNDCGNKVYKYPAVQLCVYCYHNR